MAYEDYLGDKCVSYMTEALLLRLLLRIKEAGIRKPEPRYPPLRGGTYEYRITWVTKEK